MTLSADRIRRLLKKRFRWKRTRHSHLKRQNAASKALAQQHLAILEALAEAGQIEVKYLDETGCAQWSAVSYSYARIGTQKQIEQTSVADNA